jgi:hypothetical protein
MANGELYAIKQRAACDVVQWRGSNMTDSVKKVAKRDGRLSLALLMFVVCAGAVFVQSWILMFYFRSAIHQDWTYFLKNFPSYAPPTLQPGEYCFDDCFPGLPFIAGWIGIVSFCLGWSLLAYSWWRPRPRNSP